MSDASALALDVGALAETEGFGALMDYLDKNGWNKAERIGKVASTSSAFLAYVKLVVMNLNFEAKLAMENSPLVRVKFAGEPGGEARRLTLDARFRIGHGQWFNCLRLMFAQVGLDFDLPNDGPIGDARVHWNILNGGPTGSGVLPIIRFSSSNSPSARQTNKDGRANVVIQGYPQPRDIPEPRFEWRRHATVGAEVQIQAANIWNDMIDAIGTRGGISLAAIPAELFQRTRWLWNTSQQIEVIDWRPHGYMFEVTRRYDSWAGLTTQPVLLAAGNVERHRFIQCNVDKPWDSPWHWKESYNGGPFEQIGPMEEVGLYHLDPRVPVLFSPGTTAAFGFANSEWSARIGPEGQTALLTHTWSNDPSNPGAVPPGLNPLNYADPAESFARTSLGPAGFRCHPRSAGGRVPAPISGLPKAFRCPFEAGRNPAQRSRALASVDHRVCRWTR